MLRFPLCTGSNSQRARHAMKKDTKPPDYRTTADYVSDLDREKAAPHTVTLTKQQWEQVLEMLDLADAGSDELEDFAENTTSVQMQMCRDIHGEISEVVYGSTD